MSNNEKPAYERTKLVLEINHLTKKFAVDGGKFLTACNDINLRSARALHNLGAYSAAYSPCYQR